MSKLAIGTATAFLALTGMVYAGASTVVEILDDRYVEASDFKSFEQRLYLRDIQNDIGDLSKRIRVHETKIDTGVDVEPWETRIYNEDRLELLELRRQADDFLKPVPEGK